MSNRANLFEDTDLDLSEFKPVEGPQPAGPPPEKVREVAEAAKFTSRETKPARAQPAARPEPRRHRTGRTMQFNCRTTKECADGMYAIADQQGWLVGETLERAYAALRRELEGQGRG